MAQQNPRVVRTGKKSGHKRKKKPLPKALRALRGFFAVLGKILLTTILVLTITGCIVGTAMTIYVMQYVDSGSQIDITNLKMSYTSVIYGKDAAGNDVEVQQMHQAENRFWVDYDQIPKSVKLAFVCAEDKRFFQHEGVDFLRTGSAFLNFVKTTIFHIGDDDLYGGSTITQQLIKNINGDMNNRSPAVKIKELMQAMNMERNYTKNQILEAYLNYAAVGPNVNGVQAGALYYFGKNVWELDPNEAAALAVCVKNPNKLIPTYNNTDDPNYEAVIQKRESRRVFILSEMLDMSGDESIVQALGSEVVLTQAQYDSYAKSAPKVAEKNTLGGAQASNIGGYSYYVDAVIEDVIDALMEKNGWSREETNTNLMTGGYQIYTPMEIETQNKLEELFVNPETFAYKSVADDVIPDAAMVLISMKEGEEGYVSALVGGRGEKTAARGFNLATDAVRSFGSTIKPLSVYSPAFQQNLINWSGLFVDEPKMYKNDSGNVVAAPAAPLNKEEIPTDLPADFHYANWPNNYDKSRDGAITIIDALKVSKNTVPVEIYNLMESIKPMTSYDFLTKNFRFPDLVGGDLSRVGQDSMVLGSAGTTLLDLTASYEIFGNGGYYTEPVLFTKVLDGDGKTVLDNTNRRSTKVLDSDTAYIMNRALWNVVNGTRGVGGSPSGGSARLDNSIEVIGKTGTSMDRKDLVFMGVTPYYAAGIRYGHKDNSDISNAVSNSQVATWKKVMTAILEGREPKTFESLKSDGVIEERYCLDSGDLAGDLCTRTAIGYYKANYLPTVCTSHGDGSTASGLDGDAASSAEGSDAQAMPESGEALDTAA